MVSKPDNPPTRFFEAQGTLSPWSELIGMIHRICKTIVWLPLPSIICWAMSDSFAAGYMVRANIHTARRCKALASSA